MDEEVAQALFTAFNQVVLEQSDSGSFRLIGTPPDWFWRFFPDAATTPSRLALGTTFPFLEHFLVDAERFWQTHDRGTLKSGFWSEVDLDGREQHLEAIGVCLGDRKILLLELAENAYREQRELIQKARDQQLNYDRLVKEIQKKEVLLHCIFHDLAGQLTTFKCCLELLRSEALSDRGRKRLNIGLLQVKLQEELVREIVQAFATEIPSFEAVMLKPDQAPDLLACTQTIVNIFTPTFSSQNKWLHLPLENDCNESWKVVGERFHIERILSNLVENALRYAPEQSTVQISVSSEANYILCAVDDQGVGVPPESVKYLFQRFFQGKENSGKAGLGLYFCRITVERWGGTIGYKPLTAGGSRFWFRLRKFESQEV